MWQTLAVIILVVLAAGFLLRRLGRQFSGKAPACCGGGEGAPACASCQGAPPRGPHELASLEPGPQPRTCACGCGQGGGENTPSQGGR